MKKSLLFLALLLVPVVFAATPSPDPNVIRGTVALPDGGSPIWYVDMRGLDTNTCTAPFTDGGRNGPCRQPQAAVNKIPKMLRHRPTVSIDAGTYNGFLVTGFSYDYGAQQAEAGLLFDGVLTTSVLTSGPATGTATSGTAGSGTTFGTLVQTGAGWIVNDLTGRFITTATPTNAAFVVSSNTSDTVTVVGTWAAPTGSTTFTIQDPATEWTGLPAMTEPANPIQAGTVNRAAIFIAGNNLDWSRNAVVVRNMRFTNDAGVAIEVSDRSGVRFENVQMRPVGGLSAAMIANAIGSPGGPITLNKCDLAPPNNTNPTFSPTTGPLSISNSLLRAFAGTNSVLSMNNGAASNATILSISNSEFRGNQSAIQFGVNLAGFVVFNNLRISCAAAGGVGLRLGTVASTQFMSMTGGIDPIGAIDISGCSTAVQVRGPGVLNFSAALTGSALTTGIEASFGGTFQYVKASTTLTAPTEISLDPASIVPITSTFAGGTANSCLATAAAGYYSKACAR